METVDSPEAMRALGARLAAAFAGGEVIALHGPLGAGKTQLAKGLALGLGHAGEVTSPTFSLVHEYLGGRLPVYHLDLYRTAGPEEALRFGVEEYLTDPGAVALIEWPERIAGLLPAHARHWEIELVSETERRILFRP